MYACSPSWKSQWIEDDLLKAMLDLLSRTIEPSPYGPENIGLNHGLHFSGGEPFLNYPLLLKAVETAHALGIPSLFAETNCFWAANDVETEKKLLELKKAGLSGLMISVNPFYLEYIPFERTERAIRTGYEIFGQNLAVYQMEFYRRFSELGLKETIPFEEYLAMEGGTHFLRNTEFFLNGRAPYAVGPLGYFPNYPVDQLIRERCTPDFLRPWHNHFDNSGNYMPGYCGGLTFGSLLQLDTLLEKGIDIGEKPVLGFIAAGDFEGLLRFAVEQGFNPADGGYRSKCHFCVELRKHLSQSGKFTELQPAEFYSQVSPV
jgi:hypothetical protein